jgi:fibronectin type 3 domain-containing protein
MRAKTVMKKRPKSRKKARPPGHIATREPPWNPLRFLPDTPTGVTAQGLSQTEILVQWQPSANADSYTIWRAASPADPFLTHATTATPGFRDTGLLPGQRFCYQILAVNLLGRSSGPTTPPVCATTSTLPIPVSGLIAQATSSTTIVLQWPPAAGAAYYGVWGADSPGGPFNTIGTTNLPSYTVTGLLPGRTYCYLVLSVNSAGNAAAPSGPPTCVTTPAVTAPQNVSAVTQSSSSILLTWNAVAGATSYNVFRSTNAAGPFTTSAGVVTTPSFTDTGLSSNRTYYYAVSASGSGYTSPLSAPAAATTAPSVPTGVTAQPVSPTSVDIGWNASTGALRYDVYRGPNLNGQGSMKVGTATGTTFRDNTVPAGSSWFYWVTASNAGGESARSNFRSVTTPPFPPAITLNPGPTGAQGQYRITWTAPAGATSYALNRQVPGSTGWTQVSTTTLTFFDVTAGADLRFYMVTAINSGGVSAPSNTVTF